jgi:signal transduction histidine kinase
MIYFQKMNDKGELVAKSSSYTVGSRSREKRISNINGDLVLVIDEKDLIKSSRIFRKLSGLALQIFDSIFSYYQNVYIAQSHTLKKIQGQLSQKIDSIIQHPLIATADSYEQQKQLIIDYISTYPGQSADTLIYLQKRIFELGAHMASFELLHLGSRIHIDKKRHNIRKLILNVWHGFDDIFSKKNIRYRFYFEDGIAEENKCLLDYKTINAALYNIFDNAAKYSKPDSEVRFNFDVIDEGYCLQISTLSIPVEEDEITSLCTLGFRGRNSLEVDGSGIGLYIAKKAMDLNNLKFSICPLYSSDILYEGKRYIKHTFKIEGNKN